MSVPVLLADRTDGELRDVIAETVELTRVASDADHWWTAYRVARVLQVEAEAELRRRAAARRRAA